MFFKECRKNPNFIIGDHSYYDDFDYVENFEKNVNYHFDFVGDNVADVIFFRIANGVIFAVPGEKKKYPLMEETLSALEEQLDPQQFFLVNC